MAVDKNIIKSNIYSVVATQALVQVFSWTDSPNRYPSSQKRKLRQSYYTMGLKSHRDWGAAQDLKPGFPLFCAVLFLPWDDLRISRAFAGLDLKNHSAGMCLPPCCLLWFWLLLQVLYAQSASSLRALLSAALCLNLPFTEAFIEKSLLKCVFAKMKRNIFPLLVAEFLMWMVL